MFLKTLQKSQDNTCIGTSFLTLSWRRPISYRNQSIDLQSKPMDWFLYDTGLPHERVKKVTFITQVFSFDFFEIFKIAFFRRKSPAATSVFCSLQTLFSEMNKSSIYKVCICYLWNRNFNTKSPIYTVFAICVLLLWWLRCCIVAALLLEVKNGCLLKKFLLVIGIKIRESI